MPEFHKIKVLEMENIYTANAFEQDGNMRIGIGPEREGNPWIVDFPSLDKVEAGKSPGGMMSFVPVPGCKDTYVSVMGLFPPFKGKEGGIFKHVYDGSSWKVTKVIDLPFAHRCEILHKNGVNYLVSATVSSYKDCPEDWSKPGQVFFTTLTDPECDKWNAQLLMPCLYRNHGMLRTVVDGNEVIAVSGAEGIFAVDVDKDGRPFVTRLFNREVSEFGFVDLDGDGVDELATIEPFHGNTANIYHKKGNGWERIFQDQLMFGHGLCTGVLNGNAVAVAGNRRGECNLNMYYFSKESNAVKAICVEEGTGTTQSQIFSCEGQDFLLCANQPKSEAAVYILKDKLI